VRTFVEKQIDEFVENGPDIVKATLGLLVGCAVLLVLVFQVGFVAYIVGMLVTALIGAACLFRADVRPFGKGLLAAASAMLSLLPVLLFGAIFSSLG
jgi:hypothetical protein